MKAVLLFCAVLVVLPILVPYLVFRQPPMPAGTNLNGPTMPYAEAELLIDRTRWNLDSGEPMRTHEIFETMLRMIDEAEDFILLDFFLWNPWKGGLESKIELRGLSGQLVDALIRKRTADPDLPILAITDPINRIYGDHAPELYDRLVAAGIPLVYTDVSRLPDSNLVYAPIAKFWGPVLSRLDFASWREERLIGNPFNLEGRLLTISQLGRLLYFKANHRKVLITGNPGGPPTVLLCSFNPADGSANHSNLGLRVSGPVAGYAAQSELDIANWSLAVPGAVHGGLDKAARAALDAIQGRVDRLPKVAPVSSSGPTVAWRSEGAIRDEIIAALEQTGTGDRVRVAVFYLSDRKVVRALKAAVVRGANMQLVIDANRDAFGRKKNGVPNRPVAAELMAMSDTHDIAVRWAATRGEQFHAKAMRIAGEGKDVLFLGSANWTRRNIGNLNLEANLLLHNAGAVGEEFDRYFESIWTNGDGYEETLPYEVLAESGFSLIWKKILYHLQEASGASTF